MPAPTTTPALTSRWSATPHRRPKASSSRCTPRTHTKRLGYLVAHRPGFVAPTLMARKIATFDHLTDGRLAVHIITGKTDEEQQGDGDFSPKVERYKRAAEYLELMKLAWASEQAVRFRRRILPRQGRLLRCAPAAAAASAAVLRRRLRWRARDGRQALRRLRHLRRAAALDARAHRRASAPRPRPFGRTPGFNVSLRPIIADDARATPGTRPTGSSRQMTGKKGWSRQEDAAGPVDNAGKRLMSFRRPGHP